jgi:IclR family transcriptional regulator, acetate operon repressor
MEQSGAPAPYRIESVDKALRLLWLLQERPRVTVTDASAELGVARSTAHRLLGTLQEHGFASQDTATRAYLPGRALLEIGLAAVRNLDVRAVARPELERLVGEVRETVQLVLLKGERTLVIDSVECAEIVRVTGRTGGSLPPHCTSAGKTMLARLPAEQVRALLGPDPLERLTDRTVGTHAELAAELERVRADGYATNLGENEPAVAAVGVAVRVPRGSAPTAIAVTAPYGRLDTDRIPAVAAAARVAADRIAVRLDGS